MDAKNTAAAIEALGAQILLLKSELDSKRFWLEDSREQIEALKAENKRLHALAFPEVQ